MSVTPTPPSNPPLLDVRRARVEFGRGRHAVTAVDDVSLSLHRGQSLGLVGASGCGKTTLARAIMHLIPLTDGSIHLDGRDLTALGRRDLRRRRRDFQMVFQDPGGSLNGRMRVVDLVAEPLRVHGLARGAALRKQATAVLDRVGLAEDAIDRYPHQFSGGQRQRIAIARAVVTNPSLLVCDEPTSALDVSVQTQILRLLRDLRAERSLSMLFITHDMGVVRQMCEEVIVMDSGSVVETGSVERVLDSPEHHATRRLVEAARAAAPAVG